jgi:two-component system sensor histidine kinase CreC
MPRLGEGEIGQLGQAFEEMRTELEGKRYIEQYIQTLTHEMKSPLAAIQGAVELLREPMAEERHKRFCDNIESESKRMQRLIERLLLLASIERTPALRQPVPVDLSDLVRRAVASLAALGHTKEVRLSLADVPSVYVHGDSLLLETAVVNLLQNALDFAPRGSSIEVAIRTGNDGAMLTVADQGPGIPAYALERVFERFYSLKRPDTGKKSTGLGLSLVREIMALHGGEVRLENRTDGGVLATLIFPG